MERISGRKVQLRLAILLLITPGILTGAGCSRVDPHYHAVQEKVPARLEEAEIDRLRAEVRTDPSDSQAHTRLAQAYLQQNRWGEAEKEFLRALEIDPENATAQAGLSRLLGNLGETGGSLALARNAAKEDPEDPQVLKELAASLQQAGRWAEAARTFERVLELDEENPKILLSAAQCWARAEDWERATEWVRRAVEAAPEALDPRLLREELHLQQGEEDRAASALERLAEEFPDRAVVHEALGRARQAQGRLEEALAAFTEAQRLRPQWRIPSLQAGEICLRLQTYQEAEKHFRKALHGAPGFRAARLGLAQAFLGQGKRGPAIELLESILEDHPEEPEALNNLAFLYAEKGEKLEQAFDFAQRAVELSPQNSGMRDTLGWVCYRQGRFEEAQEHLQEALRLEPDEGLLHFHLAQTWQALKQDQKAVQAYRRALDLGLPPREKQSAQAALRALTPKVSR